jgi:hypothetical protein
MPITINGTTGIAGVDGSASTPSLQGADTNTGMFFPAADTIAFAEGGTESMRIDSSGKLLVGTTTAASGGGVVQTIVGSGSNDGGIQVTSGTGVSGGGLAMNSLAGGGAKFFSFTGNAGSESYTERMRIDSNGTVCINTTAPPFSDNRFTITYSSATQSAASIKNTSTTFNGNMWSFVNSSNASCGAITQTGTTTTAFTTSSDYRLKENIAPMTGALDMVAQLKPVTYTWKEDGSDGQGFIAHELQEVVPDCVIGTKDELDKDGNPKYQGVDTSFLVATLTAAIQEQQTIIESLKTDIAELKAKVGK